MRPPTIIKAGIGWTGSAVSWADRIHTDGKECTSTLPQRDKCALGWEQRSTTYRTGLFQSVSWSLYKCFNNLCQYHQLLWVTGRAEITYFKHVCTQFTVPKVKLILPTTPTHFLVSGVVTTQVQTQRPDVSKESTDSEWCNLSVVLHHPQSGGGCWKRQNADTAREGTLTSAMHPISRANSCSLSQQFMNLGRTPSLQSCLHTPLSHTWVNKALEQQSVT